MMLLINKKFARNIDCLEKLASSSWHD